MKELIYIVEDDEGMREVYQGAFEDAYEIKLFENGKDFFYAFAVKKPDLVILDIMLPEMDGFTILTKIREMDERIPVICVSAKSDEVSFVKGLNRGADDYMAKPFSVLELMARVKTNLRRAKLYITSADGFSIDNNLYKAFYNGTDLGLTIKEFKLLKILIGKAGVTVEREELFRDVWGEDYMGETRTLDMHIAAIREMLLTISINFDKQHHWRLSEIKELAVTLNLAWEENDFGLAKAMTDMLFKAFQDICYQPFAPISSVALKCMEIIRSHTELYQTALKSINRHVDKDSPLYRELNLLLMPA